MTTKIHTVEVCKICKKTDHVKPITRNDQELWWCRWCGEMWPREEQLWTS